MSDEQRRQTDGSAFECDRNYGTGYLAQQRQAAELVEDRVKKPDPSRIDAVPHKGQSGKVSPDLIRTSSLVHILKPRCRRRHRVTVGGHFWIGVGEEDVRTLGIVGVPSEKMPVLVRRILIALSKSFSLKCM